MCYHPDDPLLPLLPLFGLPSIMSAVDDYRRILDAVGPCCRDCNLSGERLTGDLAHATRSNSARPSLVNWFKILTPMVLLQRLTGSAKRPRSEANYAARIANCSARDGFGLKAYLACRLRIIWAISMPDRMIAADACDLKPSIGRTRRLIRRWVLLDPIIQVFTLADFDRLRSAPGAILQAICGVTGNDSLVVGLPM